MIYALLAGVLFGSALAICPASDKCFHGGELEKPETNKFPRCWFKEAGGHWGCYNPINESCNDINGRNMIDIASCHEIPQPAKSAGCPALDKCFHGGELEKPETNKFPRCWFKEAGGHWGCYNPINESCNNINGRNMIDIASCHEIPQPAKSAGCPALDKCFHGGELEKPETNKFPRCWFKEAGGHWGCYNPINESCNNINGRNMIDIASCHEIPQPAKSAGCPALDKCFHGGELEKPETNKFPRCWFKEAGGHWGCYNPINESCNDINGRNMIDIASCHEIPQPAKSAGCPALDKCFHGGELEKPETNKFPRCWFKEAGGHWGCYNPINESCNDINGRNMIDITSCHEPSLPSPQDACGANVCYRGGQKSLPENNKANFPSCLWKETDNTWGCYDPLNNSCSNINGRNMVDIRSCQTQPQPTRCPNLTKDGCQVNFDPTNIKTSEQPQFWVYSDNVWGCSDNPSAIASRGQLIDLMDPPAECRKDDESLYVCE